MPHGLAVLFLGCALLSALIVAGAEDDPAVPPGPDESFTLDGSAVPPNIVTVADVRRTPEGSPERTVVTAFQAVQFRDVRGLRELVTPDVLAEVDESTLASGVEVVGARLGKPFVVSVRSDGERSRVRVIIASFAPNSREPQFSTALTVPMRLVGGRWLVSDLEFVLRPASDLRRQEAG